MPMLPARVEALMQDTLEIPFEEALGESARNDKDCRRRDARDRALQKCQIVEALIVESVNLNRHVQPMCSVTEVICFTCLNVTPTS